MALAIEGRRGVECGAVVSDDDVPFGPAVHVREIRPAYYLVTRARAREGEWLTIEQGDEIGRRSRIEIRVKGDSVEVAGSCAVVAEGSLLL